MSAVTRIRTWVIAATTQCTNHYTITAATAAPTYGTWSNRQVISILAKIESITFSHTHSYLQEIINFCDF